LGINKLEMIHRAFTILPSEEEQVNLNLIKLVRQLGDHISGDEKLWAYTGSVGWLRKKAKEKVGIWIYTLCSRLVSQASEFGNLAEKFLACFSFVAVCSSL